jgi:hypothetical protein
VICVIWSPPIHGLERHIGCAITRWGSAECATDVEEVVCPFVGDLADDCDGGHLLVAQDANCANGGIKVTNTADNTVTYVCNGTNGTAGAQSTTGPVPQGNTGANVSLSLAAGSYVASWDVNSGVFTGGCYDQGTSTNVTITFFGGSTELAIVGSGGGILTIHCAGNGTGGMAELTATPTVIK